MKKILCKYSVSIISVFALLVLIFKATSVLASVTLIYFTATGSENEITLAWETATELENAGFFILRSEEKNGSYSRISSFIPAEGDSLMGAEYEYVDADVVEGVLYWYKLEAVDYSSKSEYYGPESASIGADATATATESPTKTNTLSIDITGTKINSPIVTTVTTSDQTPTETMTPTPSLTKTNTDIPATATSTITYSPPTVAVPDAPTKSHTPTDDLPATTQAGAHTSTPQPSPGTDQDNGTQTLIPLPSITMVFPSSATPDYSKQKTEEITDVVESGTNGNEGGFSTVGLILIVVVIIIWIILGAWFVLSMRRLD